MTSDSEYTKTGTDEHSPYALLQKYFDGTLGREEAEELISYWKTHPGFDSFACRNQQIHRILNFFSRLEKKKMTVELDRQAFVGDGSDEKIRLDFFSPTSFFSSNATENQFETLSADRIEQLLNEVAASMERSASKDNDPAPQPPLLQRKTPPLPKQTHHAITFLKRVVVSVVLFSIGLVVYHEFKSFFPASQGDGSVEIARLVDSVEATWAVESEEYKIGRNLVPSSLKLLSGIAKLEFGNGSEIAMEGPCELLIKGRDRAFCQQGKISVHVSPRGTGFEIGSPMTTVIDLGTAFGMDVSGEKTDVHVLEGKVEILPSRKEKFILASGRSALFDLKNEIGFGKADPAAFLNEEKFRDIKRNYIFARKSVWEQRESLLSTTDGLVYRLIPEQAGSFRRVPGSREGKTALRFDSKTKRIDTDIQRDFSSLTLLASVRFHALEHVSNTLLIGDLFYERPGNFLWQIDRSGSIQFHVRDDHHKVDRYDSVPVVGPKDRNTWLSLALVADPERGTVSHYVDGKKVGEHSWNPSTPLRLNGATIGNIRPDRSRAAIRFCDADIEEFLVFDRPFDTKTIEELYRTQR